MATASTKLALLEKAVSDLEERSEVYHVKFNDIHNQQNLIRLDIQQWGMETKQLITDQREMKDVIRNNTSALSSIQEVLNKILIERDTTKTNISTFAKTIIWIGGITSMSYTVITELMNWMKR